MEISFKFNANNTFNRIFSDDVLYYANSRLYFYCDPYVPMRNGDLGQDVTITKESIKYNRPYAHYIYEGELYLADNGSAWAKKGKKKKPSGKPLNYSKEMHNLATSHWEKAMAVAKGQQLADDITYYIKRQ